MKYRFFRAVFFLVTIFSFLYCGKNNEENHEGPNGGGPMGGSGGPNGGCEFCGTRMPQTVSLDLSSAAGLAILERDSGGSGLNLLSDEETNLVKINKDGEVENAVKEAIDPELSKLTDNQKEQMQKDPQMPRIVAIGYSRAYKANDPTYHLDADVYVLFERPFYYKYTSDPKADTWSAGSPYTCQLFKLNTKLGDMQDGVEVAAGSVSNMECITNQHEIPTWRSEAVMQFDENDILYFPAHVPGNWKDIYYSYNPATKKLSEKVNGKICWRDVAVHPSGSIFYTGETCSDPQNRGTSFFRYISPDNELIEIARDWWDFKYRAEEDANGDTTGKILFFGPDPDTGNGQPSWDSACLYSYDPEAASDSRSTRIATCNNRMWDWVNVRELSDAQQQNPSLATRLEWKDRCELEDQVFLGGGSGNINQLTQGSDAKVFISGGMQKKQAGTFKCNVEITTAHCSSVDPAHTTSSACTTAGYTWKESGYCNGANYNSPSTCSSNGGTWVYNSEWYNDVTTNACITSTSAPTSAQTTAGAVQMASWYVRHVNCQEPTTGWTTSIKGLGSLVPTEDDEDSSNLISLMSEDDEQVIKFWIIPKTGSSDEIFYTSFKNSQYRLRRATVSGGTVTRKTILENYEVYNVTRDPVDSSKVMFDGLNFSSNSYKLGTLDPSLSTSTDILNNIKVKDGLTGQIETLIIIPGN